LSRVVDHQRVQKRIGRRDVREQIKQITIIWRICEKVRVRPIGAPNGAVRKPFNDGAREGDCIRMGRILA